MSPSGSAPDPGRLRIVIDPESRPPVARVRVTGELDLATAPGLHERLQSLVREGSPSIDLDLDAVPFCDLAGLDALLRAHAAARRAGGRLVVRGSCPPLRLMVRLLRPDGVFELAPLDGEPPARRA